MSPPLVWTLTAVLVLLGLAGAVAPGLPGALLIFTAALVDWFFLPHSVSVATLWVLAVLCALSLVSDWAGAVLGAKAFGGTRWGLAGAVVGAAAGLLFGLAGLLAGAVLGAAAAEAVFAGRSGKRSLKAGLGAALGLLAGTLARVAIALAMTAWLAADLILRRV
ncbi:MAG: DUF456 domain-containing protein [Elusimicrobia bacterium]|nr:DUF456 domain-containing protein [Elusimicrobiota bacterium]